MARKFFNVFLSILILLALSFPSLRRFSFIFLCMFDFFMFTFILFFSISFYFLFFVNPFLSLDVNFHSISVSLSYVFFCIYVHFHSLHLRSNFFLCSQSKKCFQNCKKTTGECNIDWLWQLVIEIWYTDWNKKTNGKSLMKFWKLLCKWMVF